MLNQQFGNYKFLSVLGEGGMATVYLAENSMLGSLVAIKVLKEDFVSNKNWHTSFLPVEMMLVNHPNIVKNIDLIDLGDNLALTMEYIEGVTLNDFIRENGPLNILKIENILTQLLSAIKFLHENQIVHGLIRPQNIFLHENGFLKVDFSHYVFKNFTQLSFNQLQGARCFITPEEFIMGADSIDERSDIYLIGLVFFFILTASFPNNYCGFQRPFKNDFDPFPKCQITNSEKELIRIIEKACCFKKEDRYQNISQFENDISKMFKARH